MKRLKKGLFGLLFSLCIGLLSGCGGTGGSEDEILRECSNEMSAFSAFNYIRNTTLLSQQSQMDEKDILSFKLLSGSSTCEDDPSKEGKGRVFITFQYTIQGNKIEISESFDVIDYGIVKYIGMEQTVISNPKLEPLCPDVPKNDSRYVNIKLVNKTYQDYIKTGQLNIEKAKFTIRFFNEDQLLETKTTGWRGQVFYTGATPIKEKDAQFTYQFSHWDKSFSNITSDLDVYAEFSTSTNLYSITFKNDNGEILQTKEHEYGTMPEYEGEMPQHGNDGQYTYEFIGWDSKIDYVTEDRIYTATYKAIKRDVFFEVNNDMAAVVGYNQNLTQITIPSTVNIDFKDYSVTSIGNSAFKNSSLESIVISRSITMIGDQAFYGCSSLQSVVFENGSSITSIGNSAFSNCTSLNSITIPASVINAGSSAFSNCNSLIIFCEVSSQPSGWSPNWNSSNRPVYWGINKDNYLIQDGIIYVITDGNAVIKGYTSELSNNVVIPATITINGTTYRVTSIGEGAFRGCNSLTSIVIPSSVTSIGYDAFQNCSSLIIFCEVSSEPSGWDSWWNPSGRPVYWGINKNNLLIQDGIIYVIMDGNAVVRGYTNEISNNVVIPTTITINGTTYRVTSIGDNAFNNCSSLTSIIIPSSMTSIGDYAFRDCSSLTSIVIPSSITSIGYYAFYGCSSLTIICEASNEPSGWDSNWNSNRPVYWGINENNLLIQDGIIYVITDGNAIIKGYISELSNNVVIPATITINGTTYRVTSIGDYAFSDCSSLTSIVIPSSITSIGYYAFYGCSSLTIICEASNEPSGWDSNWNSNRPVYWGINENNLLIQDGIIYVITDGNAVIKGYTSELSNNVVIPATITINGTTYRVTSIGEGAFRGCNSLTSIVIPSSVTSIGKRAFSSCTSLTSIVIPSSVTSIGEDAFSGCSSLTIICEASNEPSGWDSNWNSSNRPVYCGINENNLLIQNGIIYVIEDGNAVVIGHTNEISNDVIIPETITVNGRTYRVTSIGDHAFQGCSSLTSIVIPGSVTSIGSSAFFKCTSLTSVTFEEGSKLEDIEGYVFYECSSLTSIVIPKSVTSIGDHAFWGCWSLTSIVVPSSVTSIGSGAFQQCTSLTSVTFEEGSKLESIGNSAFWNCRSLTSIVIPNSVKHMGPDVFGLCSSLTIYCESSSEPSEWDSFWNSDRPVYWAGEWSYINGIPTQN